MMEAPEIKPNHEQQGWLIGPPSKREFFWDKVFFVLFVTLLVTVGVAALYAFYLLASI